MKEYQLPYHIKNYSGYQDLMKKQLTIHKEGDQWTYTSSTDPDRKHDLYGTFFEVYYCLTAYHSRKDSVIYWDDLISKEVFGSEDRLRFNFVKTRDGNYKMYTPSLGDHILEGLESKYKDWLALNEKIDEAYFMKENFMDIYEWLDTHPIFWHIHYAKTTREFIDFETDRYVENHLSISPRLAEDGVGVEFFAEGGPTVAESDGYNLELDSHSLDIDLCATGDTWEACVLNFAKNVYQHYTMDIIEAGAPKILTPKMKRFIAKLEGIG